MPIILTTAEAVFAQGAQSALSFQDFRLHMGC